MRHSMFIYNNSIDTIHLSEIGKIDYIYCDSIDNIIDTSIFLNPFTRFPPIMRESGHESTYWPAYSVLFDSLSIIDSIQVDGLGANELIFFRSFYISSNEAGATWSSSSKYQIHKIEVWNVDTKTLLLDKIIHYNRHRCSSHLGENILSCTDEEFDLQFQIEKSGIIRFFDNKGFFRKSFRYNNYAEVDFFTPLEKRTGYTEDISNYKICSWLKSISYEFIDGEYKLIRN
jgi:hypothetical protein